MDKRNVKVDQDGYVDTRTGMRYQQLSKADLEYGEILGEGNGG